MNAIGLDLRTLARALDGEISCDEVLCPGPGHSIKDRSLSVRLSAEAEDGFVVHSFASDDPIACKDHVRAKLGLASVFAQGGERHTGARRSPAMFISSPTRRRTSSSRSSSPPTEGRIFRNSAGRATLGSKASRTVQKFRTVCPT